MLNTRSYRTVSERFEILQEMDLHRSTVVVADLPTKLETQRRFLGHYKVLEEDSVLRAADFWKKLNLRCGRGREVLSRDFVELRIKKWLGEHQGPLFERPGSSRALFSYLEQFLPLFLSSGSMGGFREFITENPDPYLRWGAWFEAAYLFWGDLQKEKWTAEEWLPAFLSFTGLPPWGRKIIMDLGYELSPLDVEVARNLAGQNELLLLIPESRAQNFFDSPAHRELMEQKNESGSLEFLRSESIETRLFSTMLSEVKDLVGTLRKWLDEGVPLSELAVVAPRVEDYWPILRLHLELEGIPIGKARVVHGTSYPSVQRWLGRLRLLSGQASFADLAVDYDVKIHSMGYEEFRRLFLHLYGPTDLNRNLDVARLYRTHQEPHSELTRDEFAGFALSHWRGPEEMLIRILSPIFQEVPPSARYPLRDWITCLSSIASRFETQLEPSSEGVGIFNLRQFSSNNRKHIYILGGCSEFFLKEKNVAITPGDAEALRRDLGVSLPGTFSEVFENSLAWIFSQDRTRTVFSCPLTDFSGTPLTPSLLWLEADLGRRLKPEVQAALACRLDEILENPLSSEPLQKRILAALDRETGRAAFVPTKLKHPPRLSVSGLQAYVRCPFVFFAERVLGLGLDPDVDLDLDARSKGKILHYLLSQLDVESPVGKQEVADLLSRARREENVLAYDEHSWAALVRSHTELSMGFLDYERVWQRDFPKARVRSRERDFAVLWNQEAADFEPLTDDKAGWIFRGRIDRIDWDGAGHGVVIDYKGGAGDLRNYSSWLKDFDIQLLLYSYLLDRGLVDPEISETWGAVYYVPKTRDRNRGFLRTDVPSDLFRVDGRKRHGLDRETFDRLCEEMKVKIKALVEQIEAGRLFPDPEDQTECGTCEWRYLCRAPHRN